ncbi:MAG: hypothetical protein EAX86_00065 [Candidatus Heimdallarchaeota archaeon]|nr:hypothetical protein [Candidatus Heimdallarchaeota archaeon]
MRTLNHIKSKSRRGQMFILATMLIAIYLVTMTAALMNLGVYQIDVEQDIILEPYNDVKREIQYYLEFLLADYSSNESIISLEPYIARLQYFLRSLELSYTERGVQIDLMLKTNEFHLQSNKPPYSNTTDSTVYISQIGAIFELKLSTISSSYSIEETFSISYIGRAEIDDTTVIVQESRGKQFHFINAFSIFIDNGSILIPSLSTNQIGVYSFETIGDINNLGILYITLENGIRIFS